VSNIVKLYSGPKKLAEDERLRAIAQRALAPLGSPFDGLHVEAAMVLNQLGLVKDISKERRDEPEPLIAYSGDAS